MDELEALADESGWGGIEVWHLARAQFGLQSGDLDSAERATRDFADTFTQPEIQHQVHLLRMARFLAAGDAALAARELERFALAGGASDNRLLAGVRHVSSAWCAYASGDLESAIASGGEAIRVLPAPTAALLPGGYPITLDTLSFLIEAGRTEEAGEWIDTVNPWLTETVAGRAVGAAMTRVGEPSATSAARASEPPPRVVTGSLRLPPSVARQTIALSTA